MQRLVDRHPTVSPERLIAQLVPPPTFADVSFDNYRPDSGEPTQGAAVEFCRRFCAEAVKRKQGKRKMLGKRETLPGVGLYLDGGFGVGKTHLLASAYYSLAGAGAGPCTRQAGRDQESCGGGTETGEDIGQEDRQTHADAGIVCRSP